MDIKIAILFVLLLLAGCYGVVEQHDAVIRDPGYRGCIKLVCKLPLDDCKVRPSGCHYGD